MKKLMFIFLIFISTSCSCQNFFWSHTGEQSINYGYLYNWYAASKTGATGITSSADWALPTMAQFRTIIDYYGGASYTDNTVGTLMKEVGAIYWGIDNTGTNFSGFNGRGSGLRTITEFSSFKSTARFWNTSKLLTNLSTNNEIFYVTNATGENEKSGLSIRLLYTGVGTPTSYTGNDGKIYRIILIGSQYWLADNLAETKYRDGSWITGYNGGTYTPIATAAWAALTTEAMCAYNDLESNAINP